MAALATTGGVSAEAIAAFPGGVLLVSHDRELIERSCNRFWLIKDGRIQMIAHHAGGMDVPVEVALAEAKGLKLGKLAQPLRAALTGRTLKQGLELLGLETLERM